MTTINEPVIEDWLSRTLNKPAEAFVPLENLPFSVARPLEESKGTLGIFVNKDVNPHRLPDIRWKAHAADPYIRGDMDLLRADYQAIGLQVRLTESINFVFLEVKQVVPGTLTGGGTAYLRGLIAAVVNSESGRLRWVFDVPEDIDTAPKPALIRSRGAPSIKDLQSRFDRADLLAGNSSACFIFYKKVDQLEFFQREDRWFRRPAAAR